jgi:hypothetical protein
MLGNDSAVRHDAIPSDASPGRRCATTARRRLMTSPTDGPVEWVAITFPWENLWASGFADTVRTHGGSVLAYDRVLPAAVAAAREGSKS